MRALNQTVTLRVICVFFLFGTLSVRAAPGPDDPKVNSDAFVYLLNMGIEGSTIQYNGLRNGIAIGNGQYVLTAAHCVADFQNSNQTLLPPLVISPYYGDLFEAEIVAIDKKSDIAILKPAWGVHPALELETSEQWKNRTTITIVGYPPTDKERGGNGELSRQILPEEVCLARTPGKDVHEILVGRVNYAGVGWSGSPFVNPETGRIVGVFCRYDTYEYKKFFFFKRKQILHSGPGIDSIRRLFDENHLSYDRTEAPLSNLHHRPQFERILSVLDIIKPDNEKQIQTAFHNLCKEIPDSYLSHIMAGWYFDPPENEPYYQKALETGPNSTLVHAAFGYHLLCQGEFKKAAKQFQIVTERDPNHLFAYHGQLASLVIADPNAAETLGRELTQRWPQKAGFWFEYSRALRANNKREEELSVMRRAVELSQNTPYQYQRYLADSLTANKRYEEAEQAYKTLLTTHECERCWRAYLSLLLKMGPDKASEAKKAMEKAKSFKADPDTISETSAEDEQMLDKMLSPNIL